MERRRRLGGAAACAAAAVLLAGCGSSVVLRAADGGPEPTASPAAVQRPSDLMGMWRVSGPDVRPGSVLRVEYADLVLQDGSCREGDGSWNALPTGEFAATIDGRVGNCPEGRSDRPPRWMERAVAFRVDGVTRELLDADGGLVATLRPGGRLKAVEGRAHELRKPPRLSADQIASLDRPRAGLPSRLTPATRDALVGQWVIPAADPRDAGRLEFAADGAWTAENRCLRQQGRWTVGPGGGYVSTKGGDVLAILCPGKWAGEAASFAAAAGFDGETLVLVDADGHELDRLVAG